MYTTYQRQKWSGMEAHIVIDDQYKVKLHHDLFPHSQWDRTLDNAARRKTLEMNLNLQHLCRWQILRRIGLDNVDKIQKLPLPVFFKRFLTTFYMPEDFEINRLSYREYAVHHSRFPCHQTHQVYNGVCSFTKSNILIKCHASADTKCKACVLLGEKLVSTHSSETWRTVSHPNIQKCLVWFKDPEIPRTFYCIEPSFISLKETVHNLRCNQTRIPEYLLWDCLSRMTSVLEYLNNKGLYPEFMDTQHWFIDAKGCLKMENMLLDMCGEGETHYRTRGQSFTDQIWKSPEEVSEGEINNSTPLWGMGCIVYELANLHPASRATCKDCAFHKRSPIARPAQIGRAMMPSCSVARNGPRFPTPHSLVELPICDKYSEDLRVMIARLMNFPEVRPLILAVKAVTDRSLSSLAPDYNGPKTLLQVVKEAEFLGGQECGTFCTHSMNTGNPYQEMD